MRGGREEAHPFLTYAWFQVASLSFGYLSAAIIVAVVFLAARKLAADHALWRRVRRNLAQAGAVGTLKVLSAGNRRMTAGEELRVPYEGTMGSAHSCDVCIPYKKVHMRSAFFWVEEDGLHMVALHRDGFFVDDVPVEPGDEAVLREGAVLRVGELKLALHLYGRRPAHEADPYVTTARRSKAQQGHGDGIGAPGKSEARRERKLREKQRKALKQDEDRKARR